jgi:sugar lactone lactonase YvrE
MHTYTTLPARLGLIAGLALAGCGSDPPSFITLPGDRLFPEGIARGPDGELYVGSLALGEVLRVDPDRGTAESIIAAPTAAPRATGGLQVDTAGATLVACYSDFMGAPAALRTFTLPDGAEAASYSMEPGSLCNDLTFDRRGDVLATDSFGDRIYRHRTGSAALETWSADPLFAAPDPAIGLNGIAWDGASTVYVVRFDAGKLLRVPITADGSAGAASSIAVEPPLEEPDGLTRISATSYLVVEGVGRLSRLDVDVDGAVAHKRVLADDLDQPTTVAIVDDAAWVVEGQIPRFIANPAMPAPQLPFKLRRVALQ